jgi:hypothetical protein
VAWLCGEEWELGRQVDALQEWLSASGRAMRAAEYVANIGFQWRRDAGTGDPVLEPSAMRIAADIGLSIYFSEYAGFSWAAIFWAQEELRTAIGRRLRASLMARYLCTTLENWKQT